MKTMTFGRQALIAVAFAGTAFFATSQQVNASNLTVALTFDSSFKADFGGAGTSQEMAFEAAANAAAQQFDNLFTNPVTVNITMSGAVGTSVFGQSNWNFTAYGNYNTVRNALQNNYINANTPTALSALAHLSASDPSGVSGAAWGVSEAEQKALGLGNNAGSDGTVTIGAGNPFSLNPNSVAAGTYDFTGIVLHEISEVMGRAGLTGAVFNYGGSFGTHATFSPLDLFRYTGGALTPGNNGANGYFSIDGGATNLHNYNDHQANGLDTADWNSNNNTNDAFNQFSFSGVTNGLSAVDIQQMEVLGWDTRNNPVPEPSTFALLGLGSLGLFGCVIRRRIQRRATV